MTTIPKHVHALLAQDGALNYEDFKVVMEATDVKVDWAYEIWDDMLAGLRSKDAHRRAIAAQVLCNLAKSDPKNRMLKDFDAVFAITRDEKFVTARHGLQAMWKVGVAGKKHKVLVVDRLARWFQDCATVKNATLIRYDIIVDLFKIYDETRDEKVKQTAMALIEIENDIKYRKKYASVERTHRQSARKSG